VIVRSPTFNKITIEGEFYKYCTCHYPQWWRKWSF